MGVACSSGQAPNGLPVGEVPGLAWLWRLLPPLLLPFGVDSPSGMMRVALLPSGLNHCAAHRIGMGMGDGGKGISCTTSLVISRIHRLVPVHDPAWPLAEVLGSVAAHPAHRSEQI